MKLPLLVGVGGIEQNDFNYFFYLDLADLQSQYSLFLLLR